MSVRAINEKRLELSIPNTQSTAGASIPMGQGDMSPPIFMKGDVHGNVTQYFSSDVVFICF